jgi:hypothetical protein
MDFTKLLLAALSPIINFLKQNNLWNMTVSVYDGLSTIGNAIMGWLNVNANIPQGSQSVGYIVPFVKFVINIFLTLLDVLTKIGTWALHLFH